jgi:hypothetical protein
MCGAGFCLFAVSGGDGAGLGWSGAGAGAWRADDSGGSGTVDGDAAGTGGIAGNKFGGGKRGGGNQSEQPGCAGSAAAERDELSFIRGGECGRAAVDDGTFGSDNAGYDGGGRDVGPDGYLGNDECGGHFNHCT